MVTAGVEIDGGLARGGLPTCGVTDWGDLSYVEEDFFFFQLDCFFFGAAVAAAVSTGFSESLGAADSR